jgi:hypothetical protein
MSPLIVTCIVFGALCAGAILGMVLRTLLPEHHLEAESKDLIKVAMGLIGTMSALVLGLLVASAKNSFDTQRNGVAQLAGNVMFLDRTLARYGPESAEVRSALRSAVQDTIERTWPSQNKQADPSGDKPRTAGRHEMLFEQLQALAPKNDNQRAMQAQAIKTATDIGQARWLLYAQEGNAIPTVFLAVMVSWLALIFASFTLFAPKNITAVITLLICIFVVSSSIFLILELDHPFEGVMQIPSTPLQNALAQLGK